MSNLFGTGHDHDALQEDRTRTLDETNVLIRTRLVAIVFQSYFNLNNRISIDPTIRMLLLFIRKLLENWIERI